VPSHLAEIAQTLRDRVTVTYESTQSVQWLWNGQHFEILETTCGWRVSAANIGWRAQTHAALRHELIADTVADALEAARALART
jgi:hypothetical protein